MKDVQQLQCTLGALLLFLPVVGQAEERGGQIILHGLVEAHLHIVDDGQLLEQPDVLEGAGHAHPVDLIGLLPGGGHTIDEDGAAGRLIHVGQQVEHSGLTGTVGADEARDLVAADHQVEAVHGGQTAEVDAQLTDVEDGLLVLVAVGQKAAGRDAV